MNKVYEKITLALCESLADAIIAASTAAAAHGVTTYKALEALTKGKGKKVSKATKKSVQNLINRQKEREEGLTDY